MARFVSKLRAGDPEGAAELEQEIASTDIIEAIAAGLVRYGLRVDDLADAYAIWWVAACNAIKGNSGNTLTEINKRVGFRFITKFGEKGVINLGKAIPLLGGLIGGPFDLYATNKVGNVARDTFVDASPSAGAKANPKNPRKPRPTTASGTAGKKPRRTRKPVAVDDDCRTP